VHETTNFCFVCGIENVTFDRGIGRGAFRKHIKSDHHMWDYVRFMIYIWEQDMDDDDGLEQYVRRCVDSRDLSWFPINKSMDLVTDDSEMNENQLLIKHVADTLNNLETEVNSTMMHLQSSFFSTAMSIQHAIPAKSDESVELYELSVDGSVANSADSLRINDKDIDESNDVKARVSKVEGLMELHSVNDPSQIIIKMISATGQKEFVPKNMSSGSGQSVLEFSRKDTLVVHRGTELKHGEFIQIQVLELISSKSRDTDEIPFHRFVASAEITLEDLVNASGSHVDVTLHINGSSFVVSVSSIASAALLKK